MHEAVSAKKRVPTPPTSCYDRSHQISEHIFEGREKVKKEKRKREKTQRRRKERREDLASCFVSWWLTVWVRGVGLYSSLSRNLDTASCVAAFLTPIIHINREF